MARLSAVLLASTATIATSASFAADLPVKKAASIEYVRVCGAYGAGFFYIPGTDTCIRLSGRARLEAGYLRTLVRGDLGQYRGLARFNLDARTQTSYGTLRAFLRIEAASRTGVFMTSGTQQRIANAFPALGPDTFGRVQNFIVADKAFVQFAGLTAGRASSFFDFYAHDFEILSLTAGSDVASTNLLAYTAKFGEGWSATISAEDPSFRWQPIYANYANGTGAAAINTAVTANSSFAIFTNPTAFSPVYLTFDALGRPASAVEYDVTQKNRTPDFIGALRYDAAWGSAQLSAAVHEVGIGNALSVAATPFTDAANPVPAVPAQARPSNAYGFGVQAGVKVNLPFLAPGDALYLQGAYAEGAMSYTGYQQFTGSYAASLTPYQNAQFTHWLADAILNPVTGRLELSESFSLVGSLLHYWSPEWRSAFYGSYGEVSFGKAARQAVSLQSAAGGNGTSNTVLPNALTSPGAYALSPVLRDNNQLIVGASLIWSPVKDLDIGVEGQYVRTGVNDGRVPDATRTTLRADGQPLYTITHTDTYQVRARVQRDF